jgi:hypothetical protein
VVVDQASRTFFATTAPIATTMRSRSSFFTDSPWVQRHAYRAAES